MAYQIIKQPDGQYALWGTNAAVFVLIDATPHDIVQFLIEEEAARIQEQVRRIVADLDTGGKPYHQFTVTWKQALRDYKAAHGRAFDLEAACKEMAGD